MMKNNHNIENGLYPNMLENPQLRWAFIRKVYAIICIQYLFSFAIASSMFFNPGVKTFLRQPYGLFVVICIAIYTIASLVALRIWNNRHPWNYVLMLMFTLGMSVLVGCMCAIKKGEVVLTSAGLTLLVTVTLTLYTFWGAKRGYDFEFLYPFLLCGLLILLAFVFIRILFPFGGTLNLIFGCLGALVFSGFIIFDTNNLIKNYSYDEYFPAAISLYLDIINLFIAILGISSD